MCWLSALAATMLASPARADEVARWRVFVEDASSRFGVPVSWIERVMRAESRGRTTMGGRPIRSRAGAMGLMQLMPATWAEMRARLALGADPDDPHDNILAGTFYLRLMHDRFGYPGLFGAYNAGPARYAAHLSGVRLPAETVAYMRATAGSAPRAVPVSAPPAMARPTIFALVFAPVRTTEASPAADTASPIFAVRRDTR